MVAAWVVVTAEISSYRAICQYLPHLLPVVYMVAATATLSRIGRYAAYSTSIHCGLLISLTVSTLAYGRVLFDVAHHTAGYGMM